MFNLFCKKINTKKQLGSTIVLIIILTGVFTITIVGVINLIIWQKKLNKILNSKDTAMQIAEAGINYYRWHLAHATSDYTDGNGDTCTYPSVCGPYTHDYYDHQTGIKLGVFSLLITPPPTGSTLVTINSTGWLTDYVNQKRIIEVQYGKPSLAKYAILSNSFINIASGTTTYGLIHSNQGVRLDGEANNLVTSYETTFNDPDHSGDNEYGVHTHVTAPPGSGVNSTFRPDEAPPTTTETRTDVFKAGRVFPVGNIDYSGLSKNFNTLLAIAEADSGCQISNKGCTLGDSEKAGWHIQITNTTFRYSKVKKTNSCSYVCPPPKTSEKGDIEDYVGGWTTKNLPSSGVIFVKDNVWVDGTINGARVTIVAAIEGDEDEDEEGEGFSATTGGANIWINNHLRYTDKDNTDGTTDAIGLIAQNNISVGLYTKDDLGNAITDLYIDAAMIAKNGRVGRYFYPSSCDSTYYRRNSINIYGSIMTNGRYDFYIDKCSSALPSGFITRNISYDNNFTYAPPPNFPTEDNYTFLSWEEK